MYYISYKKGKANIFQSSEDEHKKSFHGENFY